MSYEACEIQVQGASFVVRIIFGENASYQGEITWLEEEKTLHFRSVLEMMTLIQEAADESCVSAPGARLRSWCDNGEPVSSSRDMQTLGRG